MWQAHGIASTQAEPYQITKEQSPVKSIVFFYSIIFKKKSYMWHSENKRKTIYSRINIKTQGKHPVTLQKAIDIRLVKQWFVK